MAAVSLVPRVAVMLRLVALVHVGGALLRIVVAVVFVTMVLLDNVVLSCCLLRCC